MATVKETVKEFYKKANEKKWYKFLIYPNELKAYGVDRCVSYDPKEDCPYLSLFILSLRILKI